MICNILLSMWHNKWRTLLILLLLTISFFLCFLALTNSFSFYMHISEVGKMFSVDTESVYIVNACEIEDFDNSGVDLTELKDFVNQQNGCIAGAYDVANVSFPELENNQEFIDLNKRAYTDTRMSDFPYLVDTLYLDPEMLQMVNFELSPDDIRPVEKDGKTYLPLYIGKDFENIVKKGDILTDTRLGVEYLVSGVLPETKWFNDNDAIVQPTISLNHMYVTSFSDADKADPMSMQSTVGKIFLKCDENTADQFIEKSLQKNMKLGTATVHDYIEEWKQAYGDILRQNISMTIIVAVCSIISIISALCVTVVLKKKEYGIRIAFGSSIKQIILSYAFEMIILTIISGVIGFSLCYDSFANQLIDPFHKVHLETLCTSSLFYFIVILTFLLFIILFIPSIILLKYHPADLIKEEE